MREGTRAQGRGSQGKGKELEGSRGGGGARIPLCSLHCPQPDLLGTQWPSSGSRHTPPNPHPRKSLELPWLWVGVHCDPFLFYPFPRELRRCLVQTSQPGVILLSRGTFWQSLETFLVATIGVMVVGTHIGGRGRRGVGAAECPGQSPEQRSLHPAPNISSVAVEKPHRTYGE